MCPQFPKLTSEGGRVGPSRSHRRETVLPATPNHHKLQPSSESQTPALGPASPSKSGDAAATFPYPLTPPIPYPTPMPTPTRARPRYTSRPAASLPPRSTAQSPAAAQRRKLRVQGLPCQGVGAGPALPCFPLSISGHLSPKPSTSVRLAPWQIRLVPLCRPFPTPSSRAVRPRPASAWQIRLVSLCRLVRRASIPSCTASLQARRSRKNARHNSRQFKPSAAAQRPKAVGAGLALPCRRPRRRVPYGETHPQTRRRP